MTINEIIGRITGKTMEKTFKILDKTFNKIDKWTTPKPKTNKKTIFEWK